MEEKSVYDPRKKILTRTITENQPVKVGEEVVGEHKGITTQTYKEEGIRRVWQELRKQHDDVMKILNNVNNTIEANKDLIETPELKKLREDIQAMQRLDKKVKAEQQREYALEQMKEINKQMATLKEAVGTHIKL